MHRHLLIAPFAACLALGSFGCFSSSSGGGPAPAETFDATAVDSAASGDDDATAPSDASTFDATALSDASTDAGASADAGNTTDASSSEAGSDAGLASFDAGAGCSATGAQSTLSAGLLGYPTDGLVLWLRADHGVYATADSRVCAWVDQSGNGTILGNGGPTRPLLAGIGGDTDGGVGGQPGIFFDAPGSALATSGVLGLADDAGRTFIVVTRMVATGGRFQSLAQGQSGTGGTYMQIDANTWQTTGNLEGVYIGNNSFDSTTATSTDPHVLVFTASTLAENAGALASIDYRVNGVTQTLTLKAGSGSLAPFAGANFTQVGNADTTNSVGSTGTGVIAEVLVYGRALDVTERAQVEGVLEARYAIP